MDKIKSIMKYFILAFIFVMFLAFIFGTTEDKTNPNTMLQIGQKAWTYDIDSDTWSSYSKNDDYFEKKIVLKLQLSQEEPDMTYYELLTQTQLKNKYFYAGEGSFEFIKDKSLYSYRPKSFEYYKIFFNGVDFIQKKLTESEVSKLFNHSNIIKMSDIKKGNYKIKHSKNLYIILNDVGESFYRYYIIPNDSQTMQIENFSNQFRTNSSIIIHLQRLEGCTKAYPCYEFEIKK